MPVVITLGTILILLASGHWANRRFSDFDLLPGHFDASGRASRMTPRKKMVWLLPVTFSFVIAVLTLMMYLVPESNRNGGDPLPVLAFSALCLLFAQGFVLWLTDRWANKARNQR